MLQQNGILVLNKPKGLSSAQCVGRIKRLDQKKIGHAGTLDPMAEGVLIVLLGQATKLSGFLLEGGEKTYSGAFRLGMITDTWDAEGRVVEQRDTSGVTEDEVRKIVRGWLGHSTQEVPPYSAAKHEGQPLYKLARAGKEVPVKTKEIFISHAEVQWVDLPDVRFRVTCSSGSYIRSLAHSLGMRVGCGATLTELTREYSHPFGLHQSYTLDDVLAEPERLPDKVLPLSAALPDWPVLEAAPSQMERLRNGNPVAHTPEWGEFREGTRALLRFDGEYLALAEAKAAEGRQVWTVTRGLFTP